MISFNVVCFIFVFWVTGSLIHSQRTERSTDQQTSDLFGINDRSLHSNNRNSFAIGNKESTRLEDYKLLEKLWNFNRKRISERIVHAVGTFAKGIFTVTKDVSQYTMADFLQPVGKKTSVAVRFSTMMGSPETLRDLRGFAVKFYTEQGNYDLVGSNIPVFFLRDGFQFPDMIHALKPDPITHRQEWWRIWNFFQNHPESVHMWMWLLDDVGIPRDYRHMDGFGVHTFKWINRTGHFVFVKYHWKSEQGVESLINGEQVCSVKEHHHATWDLYQAIQNKNYPRWKLYVQILDPLNSNSLDFDPLDPTLIWPETQFPLHEVGVMTLTQNINDSENEQIAFCPAQIVPGIDFSDDKLLRTRLFSYTDIQRFRLGANYLMLPINTPKNKQTNNMNNQEMNEMKNTKEVNLITNQTEMKRENPKYSIRNDVIHGTVQQTSLDRMTSFIQAKIRYNSFDNARKLRFQTRLIEALHDSNVQSSIRDVWIGIWARVDEDLSRALIQKNPTVKSENFNQEPSTSIPTPPNPWNITSIPELLEKYEMVFDKFKTTVIVLASLLAIVGLLLIGAIFLLFLQRRALQKAHQKEKSRLFGDTNKVEL